MPEAERDGFEVLLEYHESLRAHVAELQEAAVHAVRLVQARGPVPRPELKERLLRSAAAKPREPDEAFVVTDSNGFIEWVNPVFTAMCGFTLDELRGRKPGHLLQGQGTDRSKVQRIREALRTRQSCRETLLNYHKDGSPYAVDVRICPILDEESQPLWFVARERKLPEVSPVLA